MERLGNLEGHKRNVLLPPPFGPVDTPQTPPHTLHSHRPLSHVCDKVEEVAPHQLQQQEGSTAAVIRCSRQVGGQLLRLRLLLDWIGQGLGENAGGGPIVPHASRRGCHGLHGGDKSKQTCAVIIPHGSTWKHLCFITALYW